MKFNGTQVVLLLGVAGFIVAVVATPKTPGVDLVVPRGYVVVGSFSQSLSALDQSRLTSGDRVTIVLANPDDPSAPQYRLKGTITTISDNLLEVATDKNWAYKGAEGEPINGLFIEGPDMPVPQLFASGFSGVVAL